MTKVTAAVFLVLALALGGTWTAHAQQTCAEVEFINEDMYGFYIPRTPQVLNATTISACCSLCYSSSTCYAWTFDTRPSAIYGCYLRTQAVRATSACTSCISGVDSRVASLRNLTTVTNSITTPLNIITLNSTILTRSWPNATTGTTSTTTTGSATSTSGASSPPTSSSGTIGTTGLGGSGSGTGTSSSLSGSGSTSSTTSTSTGTGSTSGLSSSGGPPSAFSSSSSGPTSGGRGRL